MSIQPGMVPNPFVQPLRWLVLAMWASIGGLLALVVLYFVVRGGNP